MLLKMTPLFTLLISLNAFASIAIPDGEGTYSIFQDEYIFFKCTDKDLLDPVVNPLFCGDRSIERSKFDTLNFKRKLFQELKKKSPAADVTQVVEELAELKDDYRAQHVLTHPHDQIEIESLHIVATNQQAFSCTGKSCPQFEAKNGWNLVSVNAKTQREIWKDSKTRLLWGDIIVANPELMRPKDFNYQGAIKACENFTETNLPNLKFRLPTILEAEQSVMNKLIRQTKCGTFYNYCRDDWYWSSTPTPYGEHWVYPMDGGHFMKLIGMDNTAASVRCVADRK